MKTKKAKKSRGLTARQKAFIQEYPVDLNGTQAAIRANFSARTANRHAVYLLSNPVIQAEIQKAMDKRAQRTDITADRVLTELAQLAYSNIEDYVIVGEDGSLKVKTFAEMPEGAGRAIQSIKEKRRILSSGKGDGDEVILESTLELKMWDKVKALEGIGRHLKLFTDKVEHTGNITIVMKDYTKEKPVIEVVPMKRVS